MEEFLLHCLKESNNKLAAQVFVKTGQAWVGAVTNLENFPGLYQVVTPVQTQQGAPPSMMPVVFHVDDVIALMPVDETLLGNTQKNTKGGIVLDGN